MPSLVSIGAAAPPLLHPEALQAARIAARVNVSASVAQVMASLAFGAEQRDHDVMLAGLTAERTSTSMLGARS
jgi:hypothetical protein